MRPEDLSTIQRSINSIRASGISDEVLKVQQLVREMEPPGIFAHMQAAMEAEALKVQQLVREMESPGVFAQMQAAMETAMREYAKIAATAQKFSLDLESVTGAFTQILSGIKLPDFDKWRQVEQEALEILLERGWWPHPHWPVHLLHSVVELKNDGHLRRLDGFICDAYEANNGNPMRKALDGWADLPEFKMRRRIFEDGLWAYRKKKYGLAVTAWLPQIEGVLRGLAERQGFSPESWKRAATDLTANQPDYMEAFTNAFFSAFYSLYHSPRGSKVAKRTSFPFKRDAILHGVMLDFSRRAYALRIFLILDTLHYLTVEAEKSAQTAA